MEKVRLLIVCPMAATYSTWKGDDSAKRRKDQRRCTGCRNPDNAITTRLSHECVKREREWSRDSLQISLFFFFFFFLSFFLFFPPFFFPFFFSPPLPPLCESFEFVHALCQYVRHRCRFYVVLFCQNYPAIVCSQARDEKGGRLFDGLATHHVKKKKKENARYRDVDTSVRSSSLFGELPRTEAERMLTTEVEMKIG